MITHSLEFRAPYPSTTSWSGERDTVLQHSRLDGSASVQTESANECVVHHDGVDRGFTLRGKTPATRSACKANDDLNASNPLSKRRKFDNN